MPRTILSKYSEQAKPKVKVNVVSMYIKEYMRAGGLQSADVASKVGLTPSGFRSKLLRPEDAWSIGDIEKVCGAVNCPPSEIFRAIAERNI